MYVEMKMEFLTTKKHSPYLKLLFTLLEAARATSATRRFTQAPTRTLWTISASHRAGLAVLVDIALDRS